MDVVFVLDCSGSMRALTDGTGSPSRMDLAARAIELFVIGLTPEDTVGVSGFSWDTTFTLPCRTVSGETFERVNDVVYEQADNLRRHGGGFTDILLGIRNGAEMLESVPYDRTRRKVFILLTDGKMESSTAARMEQRYGNSTSQFFGSQWRPLIARDAGWFLENEIPIHVILLGSEQDAEQERIDHEFCTITAALTQGSFHWARSGEDLRPIYQRLWHQIANRPIPQKRDLGDAVEVEISERVSQMQVVLSESRRPGLLSRLRGRQLEANFYHNNVRFESQSEYSDRLETRMGRHAVAYTVNNPLAGTWRIESSGLAADIWVDVETWWTLDSRVLGSEEDELDLAQPFRFEVSVIDKETGQPVTNPDLLETMSANGVVISSTQEDVNLHSGGKITLSWDPTRSAFTGTYFSLDGVGENIPGTFNVQAEVQFGETQETTPHTLLVRSIPPDGELSFFHESVRAFGSQGRASPLAGVSPDGDLVNPVIHFQASRDMAADVEIAVSDLRHTASGVQISPDRIRGELEYRMPARSSQEIALTVEVPAGVPAGLYEGRLMVQSQTPNVRAAEMSISLAVGGPPPRVEFSALIEPGQTKQLSEAIVIPEELIPHVTLGEALLRGPGDREIPLADARVEAQEVRLTVTIPEDAPGGAYEAELTIEAPGLAPGQATVHMDVVRHRIEPRQLSMTVLPGKQSEAALAISNTSLQLVDYRVDVDASDLPDGIELEARPTELGVSDDMPGELLLIASSSATAAGSGTGRIIIRAETGSEIQIPVHVSVIGLSVERVSRHERFRVPAGNRSGPIEYRISTTSPDQLNLEVTAGEMLSDTGRALPPERVLFSLGDEQSAGRMEMQVSQNHPVTLAVSLDAPDYGRGVYEGAFFVTSTGFSEYEHPLTAEIGAIWTEGENPLHLSDDRGRWSGRLLVHSSLVEPVRLTHRIEAESEVSAAITVTPRSEAILPGQPLAYDTEVDRGRLPYGRHSARVIFDTQGLAGTEEWEIRLSKDQPGLFAAPARLIFSDLLGGTANIEVDVSTSSAEAVPLSVSVDSVSDGLSIQDIRAHLAGTQAGPGRENYVTLNVSVDSRNLSPGEYEASLRIESNDPQIDALTLPVFMQVGGLRDLQLGHPAPDIRHGGVRSIPGRQPATFRLIGSIAGRMDLSTLLETYRVRASLVATDGSTQSLDVKSLPVAANVREPEWEVSVPVLRPGHYTLKVDAENINLASVTEYVEEFYVLPQFSARLTSGGLAGFPVRFKGTVDPDDLSGVSSFQSKVVLTGPDQRTHQVRLRDDGEGGDALAGDGAYTGTFLLPAEQLGRWSWNAVHTYIIGGREFDVAEQNYFLVDAGLWIKGARLSRRDPSVLELPGMVARLGRKVPIRISTSSSGWVPVKLELGELRPVGTLASEGDLPGAVVTSGEERARATESFEGVISLRGRAKTDAGQYIVPILVSIGDSADQTAMLEFRVMRMPWWGKLMVWVVAAVAMLYAIRLLFTMGSLVLESEVERNPVSLANRLLHPLPIARVNIQEDYPRYQMDECILRFVRIPFSKLLWCMPESGTVRLNGAPVTGRERVQLHDKLEFAGHSQTLEFTLEREAEERDSSLWAAILGVAGIVTIIAVACWIMMAL